MNILFKVGSLGIMNEDQKNFKKSVERLQERAKELEKIQGSGDFEKLLNTMVMKGMASLIEDYLWGE